MRWPRTRAARSTLAEGDAAAALAALRRRLEAVAGARGPVRGGAGAGPDRPRLPRRSATTDAGALELDAARAVVRAARRRAGRSPGSTRSPARPAPDAAGADGAGAGGAAPGRRGQTNKAIAAELVLSEKTVDRHVSNIFVKLGVPPARRPPRSPTSTASSAPRGMGAITHAASVGWAIRPMRTPTVPAYRRPMTDTQQRPGSPPPAVRGCGRRAPPAPARPAAAPGRRGLRRRHPDLERHGRQDARARRQRDGHGRRRRGGALRRGARARRSPCAAADTTSPAPPSPTAG